MQQQIPDHQMAPPLNVGDIYTRRNEWGFFLLCEHVLRFLCRPMCVYLFPCKYGDTFVCMQSCMFMYNMCAGIANMRCTYVCMHARLSLHMFASLHVSVTVIECEYSILLYMYARVRTDTVIVHCTHTYAYAYIYIHTHTHTAAHARTRSHTHTLSHTHTPIQAQIILMVR